MFFWKMGQVDFACFPPIIMEKTFRSLFVIMYNLVENMD